MLAGSRTAGRSRRWSASRAGRKWRRRAGFVPRGAQPQRRERVSSQVTGGPPTGASPESDGGCEPAAPGESAVDCRRGDGVTPREAIDVPNEREKGGEKI